MSLEFKPQIERPEGKNIPSLSFIRDDLNRLSQKLQRAYYSAKSKGRFTNYEKDILVQVISRLQGHHSSLIEYTLHDTFVFK